MTIPGVKKVGTLKLTPAMIQLLRSLQVAGDLPLGVSHKTIGSVVGQGLAERKHGSLVITDLGRAIYREVTK